MFLSRYTLNSNRIGGERIHKGGIRSSTLQHTGWRYCTDPVGCHPLENEEEEAYAEEEEEKEDYAVYGISGKLFTTPEKSHVREF